MSAQPVLHKLQSDNLPALKIGESRFEAGHTLARKNSATSAASHQTGFFSGLQAISEGIMEDFMSVKTNTPFGKPYTHGVFGTELRDIAESESDDFKQLPSQSVQMHDFKKLQSEES